MDKVKKSKYAFFIEKDDGNYILYSSLSGAIIRIYEEKYKSALKEIMNSEYTDYADNDFFNTLLDKKILTDYETDENLYIRELYEEGISRSTTLEVMLIVTRECNFRCVYCGQPHESREMKDETYEAILKFIQNQIIQHGYREIRITFFGGEPLLKTNNIINFLDNLHDLLLKYSFPEKSIKYSAGISTNGYLLTPDVFDKLIEHHCNFYQISIDGMPDIHNKMRPLISGEGTWQRIMDNLRYMLSKKETFSVLLRTNFNTDVADSLSDFYKYLSNNFKDDRISVYYETIKNQGNKSTPATLNDMDGMIFDVEITKMLRQNNLISMNSTLKLLPTSRICHASKPNFYIIDENQQILKCSNALDNQKNIIGALDKNGNLHIEKEKNIRWIYNDWLIYDKCKDCKLLPLCFGKNCPKSIIDSGNMLCNRDMKEAEVEGLLENYF